MDTAIFLIRLKNNDGDRLAMILECKILLKLINLLNYLKVENAPKRFSLDLSVVDSFSSLTFPSGLHKKPTLSIEQSGMETKRIYAAYLIADIISPDSIRELIQSDSCCPK